jgi:hypothetical protein
MTDTVTLPLSIIGVNSNNVDTRNKDCVMHPFYTSKRLRNINHRQKNQKKEKQNVWKGYRLEGLGRFSLIDELASQREQVSDDVVLVGVRVQLLLLVAGLGLHHLRVRAVHGAGHFTHY